MDISKYPLVWPEGWKRTTMRRHAKFSKKAHGVYDNLSVADGVTRVRYELARLGISDNDMVISTNVPTRLDGLPRSDQANPADPAVAVYWREKNDERRCIAIDHYNRVADNLAAIAATLEALRAIERHGGAAILSRAFKGFAQIEHNPIEPWWATLGVDEICRDRAAITVQYRILRSKYHPDKPTGNRERFEMVQAAYEKAMAAAAQQE